MPSKHSKINNKEREATVNWGTFVGKDITWMILPLQKTKFAVSTKMTLAEFEIEFFKELDMERPIQSPLPET